MTSQNTPHHEIAVVGGGLGGLTLARVLHVHGINAPVYDLEPSRHARTQGGMLDLHEESGQAALRAAGLYEGFQRLVLPGGQATRVLDRHATMLWEEADDGGAAAVGRPEVERGQLRDLLLDSLPEATVRWGAKATAVRTLPGGQHEVTLADGRVFTADVLVGADGAWSKVRPLVSRARPLYTGISFVEGDLDDADSRHPGSAAVVGGGSLFALGQGRGVLAHREPDGSLHVYTAARVPEETFTAYGKDVPAADVLVYFEGWGDTLRALIADADRGLLPRPVHALPIGHRWGRVPGVTLLGDAAHVMSPFAGEGANLAMIDGADLAQALADHRDDPEKALAAYEATMFVRAETAARESVEGLDMCFAEDAPKGLVEMFASH